MFQLSNSVYPGKKQVIHPINFPAWLFFAARSEINAETSWVASATRKLSVRVFRSKYFRTAITDRDIWKGEENTCMSSCFLLQPCSLSRHWCIFLKHPISHFLPQRRPITSPSHKTCLWSCPMCPHNLNLQGEKSWSHPPRKINHRNRADWENHRHMDWTWFISVKI